MSNRLLPYGYRVHDGRLMIDGAEAIVIKEVCKMRASGMILSEIADKLNLRGIPFYETAGWDKHKVKRLLENDRYIGKDGYPPILSEDELLTARNYKYREETEHRCPPSIQKLKNIMVCEECSAKLYRIFSKKRKKTPIVWQCWECGKRIPYQDEEFLDAIREAHSLFKQELSESKPGSSFHIPDSPEARLLENKINRLLGSMDRDNDEIRLLIMQWTAQRYEDAKDTEKDHTERLRLLLDEHNLDRYDDELTAKIVSSILLNEPCTVTVRYINGMEITMGKEKSDGNACQECDADTGKAAAER